MAWNQFPMNQNYNFQQAPMQTQNVMQNTFMPIQVRDDAVAKSLTIPILKGCCQSVTVENNSTQDIAMQNAIITIDFLG